MRVLYVFDRWRRGSAMLTVLVVFAATLMVGRPGPALAAPPNIPDCGPEYTEQPLTDTYDLPFGCTGSRLEGLQHGWNDKVDFVAPVLPSSFEVNEVVTFEWPATCAEPGSLEGDNYACVAPWRTEIQIWERGPDGKPQYVQWGTYGLSYGTPVSPTQVCGPLMSDTTCVFSIDSATGVVPPDLMVVYGVVARDVCYRSYEEGGSLGCDRYDLPWYMRAAPLKGSGVGGALDVTLAAFPPGGEYPLDGVISLAQTFEAELTIKNDTDETLDDFEFTGGAPLLIDERGTGGLEIVSGPAPPIDPGMSLDPGEEVTFEFEVEATKVGIAAAHSQVTATDESGKEHVEGHSLRVDIADGVEMTKQVGQYLRMQAMDQLMQDTFGQWHSAMAERGQDLANRLSAVFTPEERLQWFGSETGFPLTPGDFATALLRGTAAEMVAAGRPKTPIKGHTAQQLEREYTETFKKELGKGVSEYIEGYKKLASGTKRFAQESWAEAMLTSYYIFGTATPPERAQFEAFAMSAVDGSIATADNLVNSVKKELPKWRENATYLAEAWDETEKATTFKALKIGIQKVFDKEAAARDKILKLAATDPVLFQQKWAERDAELVNSVLPFVLDTMIGGGIAKGAGKLKEVVVKGKGAAVIRAGESAGVLDDGGNVVKGKSAIDMSDPAIPHGPSNGATAQLDNAAYLEDVDGATVVQSTDLGKTYELPNLGGVPETTLDAKAGILKELEDELFERTGTRIQLAEVLKPSSPLRKPGGVAKTELTAQKTGKPAMLDAGAPSDLLAEAGVWRGPKPDKLPGFDDLSKPRQQAAMDEWKKAEKAWDEYHNPTDPTSKEARLRECLGQRARVPLDLEPNKVTGFQRFVTAHFEEVAVTQGKAEAKLIRVKYYEVEVYDTKTGKVLNRKTVVDTPEPVPQTPDADAVAMAKVVGTTSDGKPILAPLSRAEREIVMQRYIDKNIKARRKPAGAAGAISDLSEHGATLVMDDASAQLAGKLLAKFGLPFLPEGVGLAYLKRIAPFVSAKNASPKQVQAMFKQLVEVTRSEGGFAQHAIVVTSDSRYLGDIPFESW